MLYSFPKKINMEKKKTFEKYLSTQKQSPTAGRETPNETAARTAVTADTMWGSPMCWSLPPYLHEVPSRRTFTTNPRADAQVGARNLREATIWIQHQAPLPLDQRPCCDQPPLPTQLRLSSRPAGTSEHHDQTAPSKVGD